MTHEFGKVNVNQELDHTFITEKEIKNIKPDCGCTSFTNKQFEFTLKYKVTRIPYHLRSNGQTTQNRIKGVTVTFIDDSTKRFLIRMEVHEK